MKTPEELKKGLECCTPKWDGQSIVPRCGECLYRNEGHWCRNILFGELRRYIFDIEQRLAQAERERDDLSLKNLFLETSLESVMEEYTDAKRERDALMWDAHGCHSCKHIKNKIDEPPCDECTEEGSGWEWRGVCEEISR